MLVEFVFRWWKINSYTPENIVMCLKVVNVTGKSRGVSRTGSVGAGEAGSYRVRVQAMWLPSCLTPAVNSGVLKTARCFGNLLEGHTELSKAIVLVVMIYYRERICVNRKEPRKVVHRAGPGEFQTWTPGEH